MSAQSSQNVLNRVALPQRPPLQILKPKTVSPSTMPLRVAFWTVGILLAAAQAWVYRFQTTADSISYLDMSDGVLPGGDWHRLINGIWSPLYPLLIGLARRMFPVSAANEIAYAHLLNVVVFIFAFAGFEFLLRGANNRVQAFLPHRAYLSIAYSLFLWASISEISLRNLRPDMLMSGFLYFAVGILLRMQRVPASWAKYLALGAVLGVGYLAKAFMLPLGALILAATLFEIERWRPGVKMVAGAFALMMVIGSLYFVPLSRARGRFTLGESSAFNYLVHVDLAQPQWYLQDPGLGVGSFARPPEKIFASPPAYAFALPHSGTHPLKFDPSDWTEGVRPRFVLKRQIGAVAANLQDDGGPPLVFGVALVLVVLLGHSLRRGKDVSKFRDSWSLCGIGVIGCVIYVLVHVEPRYVGAFLVLFWCGVILSLQVPQWLNRKAVIVITLLVVASLLVPTGRLIYQRHSQGVGEINTDALAAAELEKLGVQAGDKVARIFPVGSRSGLELARIARVQVAAEVDLEHAAEFWSSPIAIQHELLQLFALRGVRAVIATAPKLNASNQADWTHLGSTQYWVWRPGSQ
jgi:hypothetical protein